MTSSTVTVTVTVSIGRNVGASPMADGEWLAFRASVADALGAVGAEIHTVADGIGRWVDDSGATIIEDSALWVASVAAGAVDALADALADLAGSFSQDAIALTVGAVRFCAPAVVR